MKIAPILLLATLLLSACSSGSDSVTDSVTDSNIESGSSSATFESIASTDQSGFLIRNAERNGVRVTESGLQFEQLREGSGVTPGATDTVTVHYQGTLTDGTEFDSSYARGEPATFALNQVILGWQEGVQLMNVGSQYRLVIPSELAYGNRGAGELIGPGAVLVFEIELLEINSR